MYPALLKKEDIFQSVSMKDAIDQMEWAFRNLYRFSSKIPIRSHVNFNNTGSSLIMPGYIKDHPYFIVKIINISQIRKPSIIGIINVFDIKTGMLVALMDAASITQIRTGATAGLATKYLSSKNSKYLCVFGTGAQALTQIEAVLEIRDITSIGIIGTSYPKSLSFSKNIEDKYSIDCSPLGQFKIPPESIICTATTSRLPLFSDSEVPPGCHINAIGSYKPSCREIPSDTIIRSKVVVDDLKSCSLEAGDLLIPEKEGKWSMQNIYCELGELVLGLTPSVGNKADTTVFKTVGNAIQDLAIVNFIMGKL